jgi:creatinine amidohydrolase
MIPHGWDWQRMSTQDHAQKRFTAALLPVGTLEAHDGGPVGTDNYIPLALCRDLAPRLEMPVLPLMPYGVTNSLLAYAGGCTLRPETLAGCLFDLGLSLHRNGLRQLIVINGHGGSTAPLRDAAKRLFKEIGLFVAVIDWWFEAGPEAERIFGPGGMGHSAVDEMAALVGLCPELRDSVPAREVPSFYNYRGLAVYPSPRPVITYDHPDDPVDLARLAPERCDEFAKTTVALLEKMIREIRDGWDAIA